MFDEWVNILHRFDYHPHDFAAAFTEVVTKKFGPDAIRGAKDGWFSRRGNVQYMNIPVGYKKDRRVVNGPVEIRGIRGVIAAQMNVLGAHIPRNQTGKVEALVTDIRKHLEARSIYRGKALSASADPEGFDLEYLDLSGVDRDDLVFSPRVWRELEDNIWTLIHNRDAWRKRGVKIQRKVLLAGKHGVGKTIAALVTAKMGNPLGWTYIQIEPSLQPSAIIEVMLEYSRNSDPVILNIEEFDREEREGNDHAIGHLLSAIDGAMSKSREMIVLMTTNFPGKITAGMNRPGRIDKMINFDEFGPDEIIALIRKNVPDGYLAEHIEWAGVTEACKGYAASFVREVGVRATFKAHSAAGESGSPLVSQEMLIEVARDLKRQHDASQRDGAGFHPPS